jgi:hypothetical protein
VRLRVDDEHEAGDVGSEPATGQRCTGDLATAVVIARGAVRRQ